jgi:hypothetical protein
VQPYDELPPQLAGRGAGPNADGGFDDAEADVVDDDDALEDGSEMIIDTQPLLGQVQGGQHATAPPPPPPLHGPTQQHPSLRPVNPGGYVGPVQQVVRFADDPLAFAQVIPPRDLGMHDEEDADDMDGVALQAARSWASIAAGPSHRQHPHSAASTASAVGNGGPSQASIAGGSQRRVREVTPYVDDAEVSSGSNTPDEA